MSENLGDASMSKQRRALVYKSTGSHYLIRDESGRDYYARLRGKWRMDEEIRSSNPVAVGDWVKFEWEAEMGEATIVDLESRRNYIVRESPQNRHQKHIVAANLDAALVMATLHSPRTSTGFIDRFMVTAEAYHIPPVLLIGKRDLWRPKDEEKRQRWQEIYSQAGAQVFSVSARQPETLPPLLDFLKDKTSLIAGHSGVGKSSLLNTLIPDMHLPTQDLSKQTGRGRHTTTFAQIYDLPQGGRLIDTPGVREIALVDVLAEELGGYFPEFRKAMKDCRFHNCLHDQEPDCAVRDLMEQGELPMERYLSYLGLLQEARDKPRW